MIYDPAEYPFLDLRWAPTNAAVNVIQSPLPIVLQFWREWMKRLGRSWSEKRFEPVALSGGAVQEQLAAFFGRLDPLQVSSPRELFVEIGPTMTACFDNGFMGSDPSPFGYMAKSLGCDGYRFVCRVSQTPVRRTQRAQSMIFQRVSHSAVRQRWVGFIREGGLSWEDHGEPLPFERVDQYTSRRILDRLPFETLVEYGAHLGIHPFDAKTHLSGSSVLMTRTDISWDLRSVYRAEWQKTVRFE